MIEWAIFALGLVSGLISGFSGSGGGLFTIPVLLLLGIPAHSAIATARLGAVGLSLGSLARFFRSDALKWDMIVPLTLISIPAAIIGANLVTDIPQQYVEKLIGTILILSSLAMMYKPNRKAPGEKKIGIFSYLAFFFARMAQAAFGSGIGLLVSVVYVKLMHLTITEASATKAIPGLVVVFISLIIFGSKGLINYQSGLILVCGTLIGSYVGSHYALKANPQYVTFGFSLMAIIFGVTLLV